MPTKKQILQRLWLCAAAVVFLVPVLNHFLLNYIALSHYESQFRLFGNPVYIADILTDRVIPVINTVCVFITAAIICTGAFFISGGVSVAFMLTGFAELAVTCISSLLALWLYNGREMNLFEFFGLYLENGYFYYVLINLAFSALSLTLCCLISILISRRRSGNMTSLKGSLYENPLKRTLIYIDLACIIPGFIGNVIDTALDLIYVGAPQNAAEFFYLAGRFITNAVYGVGGYFVMLIFCSLFLKKDKKVLKNS